LARRRAHRAHMRAAFWSTFHLAVRALAHRSWSTIPPSPVVGALRRPDFLTSRAFWNNFTL
jgi:hypothetical protein